jgi:nuclear transport factor 2 (NTF2) superfamily protein
VPDGVRRNAPVCTEETLLEEGAKVVATSRTRSPELDALDALTTDRPYRRGTRFSRAREEIRAHAGSQFDPEVVETLLEVLTAAPQVAARPTRDADVDAGRFHGSNPSLTWAEVHLPGFMMRGVAAPDRGGEHLTVPASCVT